MKKRLLILFSFFLIFLENCTKLTIPEWLEGNYELLDIENSAYKLDFSFCKNRIVFKHLDDTKECCYKILDRSENYIFLSIPSSSFFSEKPNMLFDFSKTPKNYYFFISKDNENDWEYDDTLKHRESEKVGDIYRLVVTDTCNIDYMVRNNKWFLRRK